MGKIMRRSLIAAGTALALLALAGCSSSGNGPNTSSRSGSGGAESQATRGAVPRAPAARSGVDANAGTTTTGNRVAISPSRILTADLTLRAKRGTDVSSIAAQAGDMVTAAGGEVAGDRRAEAGNETRADLILKVPPVKYQATLDRIAKLGKETSRSAEAEDVTDQVVDVASRVSSQQASVARIRALLKGAHNLGEVVQIEGELAKREADLESLKARQRTLDGQTALATITLHVRAPQAASAAPGKRPRGFVAGLTAGWETFTAATTWVLTAVGALLPFLALAAVVLAALAVARRRRQTGRPAAAEPAPLPASAP
jgi:hypothetical protein